MGLTVVQLTPLDAQVFVEYRRHQDLFQRLLSSGVFDIHGGSAELHFDSDGTLRKIDKHETVYRT